jgi:hypothetical protein
MPEALDAGPHALQEIVARPAHEVGAGRRSAVKLSGVSTGARHRRGTRPPARIRDAMVGFASAGVLALLVLYAVAAPSVSLAAKVGPVVPRPGPASVAGRVLNSSGGGVKGAHIEVRRVGRDAGAFGLSNAAGSFRVQLPGSCAVYEISVQARAEGSTVATTARRRLCPGDALPIDARVVTQGHFLWVPGPR